ncbi:MAG TPA: 4-hydroxy-tetrahydrodipicolinate reductase [Bacteroidia bacterium]|nr:4-hydroxy-tetrahydrodipicolinate reductase [Bacteroidia bacterium]HRS57916.1 4-hydroxy-tetrahydrodipicolinate reductase [Bacteroidia bacterium]HRU68275.1 4-hydroxy-tetrahydrodipicolinate reductase [Bacteroidia bacterium]
MKIFLFGYGKMGKEIEKMALSRGHEITGIYDPYFVFKFDSKAFENADIVIDFTTPGSAVYNIIKCFEANKPIVVGTTGWYHEFEEVENQCKKHNGALFYASNFSIGVHVMLKACELLAKMVNQYKSYKISISEAHHEHKKDAPSGTAITIANTMLRELDSYKEWKAYPDHSDARPDAGILPVYYHREGEIVGIHEVSIESDIDRIVIEHEAFSRAGFATGTLIATEWLIGKKGIYTMQHLFDNNK